MIKPIIKTSHLSVKVGHRFLLNDVNWQVNKGEHWVVFGMNGCGKTTLLSIVAGYKFPTGGSLKIFGDSFSNDNILNFRKRIGWVSASFYDNCYTRESVIDIVLSGKFGTLGIGGNIEDENIKLAKALLKEMQIQDKMDRPFNTLSKGERQNVLLARAFFSKPEILILDEPCTGLDIYNRAHLFSIIRQIALETDTTIIYVTHYVDEVLDIFDHALFLKQGMVFGSGSVEDMFTSDNMSRLISYPVQMDLSDHNNFKATLHVDSNLTYLIKKEAQ